MFFILETQVNKDGTGSVLPAHTKTDRNEAEAKYYQILSVAATSQVYKHGAIILDEEDYPIMYKAYTHDTEEEEE